MNLRIQQGILTAAALALSFGAWADQAANAASAAGGGAQTYEITVTNLTPGQTFTPILVATHTSRIAMFSLGTEASPDLAILAEAGDTGPLASALASTGEVFDATTIPGLLAPGASATVRINARGQFDRLSVAAMLIPTNDSFFAVNGIALPASSSPATVMSVAYDAGSEPNDELCSSIPGPACGGKGASPGAGGEGFVHVSSGVHGIADLPAAVYDWRNPAARITVRRIN